MPRELANYDSEPTAAYVAARLAEWMRLLQNTVDAAAVLNPESLPPDQVEAVQQAKVALAMLDAESTKFNTLIREMASYVSRMEYQRESSRKAFEAGWKARYTDIMAQLAGKTYEQVRDALSRIEHDPQDW